MSVEYWETDAGFCPVIEFMHKESAKARAKMQWVIDYFDTKGYSLLGTPFLKKLKGFDLYELRIKVSKILYRILVVIKKSTAWLVHAFIKKTKKTPLKEIGVALERKSIIESGLNLAIN